MNCGCLGDVGSHDSRASLGRNAFLLSLLVLGGVAQPSSIGLATIPAAVGIALLAVVFPDGVSLTLSLRLTSVAGGGGG